MAKIGNAGPKEGPLTGSVQSQCLALIARRKGTTKKVLYGQIKASPLEVDIALSELVHCGKIRVTNKLFCLAGVVPLESSHRAPRKRKELDPKSAAARTLPLPFYGGKS